MQYQDACGPGEALIAHVGECRQRNHTGKDDVARERAGQGERTERKRDTNHARAHPDFLETENWIAAANISGDLEKRQSRLIHVTDVSLRRPRSSFFRSSYFSSRSA